MLLDDSQVQQKLGLESEEAVLGLAEKGKLLRVPLDEEETRFAYPEFQFTAGGAIDPTIALVTKIFLRVVETQATTAYWLVSDRIPKLGGMTPVQWVKAGNNPKPVIRAARESANRLAQ